MNFDAYYHTLGLDKNASQEEVKKAYRKKSLKFHPDVNKAPDAKQQFIAVNEAYEVLMDKNKIQRMMDFHSQVKAQAEAFEKQKQEAFRAYCEQKKAEAERRASMKFSEYKRDMGWYMSFFFIVVVSLIILTVAWMMSYAVVTFFSDHAYYGEMEMAMSSVKVNPMHPEYQDHYHVPAPISQYIMGGFVLLFTTFVCYSAYSALRKILS